MTSPELSSESLASKVLTSGFGFSAFAVALMWVIEAIDSIILNDWLQGGGIQPRFNTGLDGILWAPFLHGDWGHLISNSLPFLVLGTLVGVGGRNRWIGVTVVVALVGGALTWIFARDGNHVGASGVIFGYLGYLVAAAGFERRLRSIVPAAIAIALYGGIWVGLKPTSGISWEGHLFGALAGILAATSLRRTKPKTTTPLL